jgi:hypothetical protein
MVESLQLRRMLDRSWQSVSFARRPARHLPPEEGCAGRMEWRDAMPTPSELSAQSRFYRQMAAKEITPEIKIARQSRACAAPARRADGAARPLTADDMALQRPYLMISAAGLMVTLNGVSRETASIRAAVRRCGASRATSVRERMPTRCSLRSRTGMRRIRFCSIR